MTANVGSIDRILRVVAGIALIAFAIMAPESIGWKWVGYFGIVPLLTGLAGTCPAYSLIGLNTCGKRA